MGEFAAFASKLQEHANQLVKASEDALNDRSLGEQAQEDIILPPSVMQSALQLLELCEKSVQEASALLIHQVSAAQFDCVVAELAKTKEDNLDNETVDNAKLEWETDDDSKVGNHGIFGPEVELKATDLSTIQTANDVPKEIIVGDINHLMFVIHGIGPHDSFSDEPLDNEKRPTNDLNNFRKLFCAVRESQIPQDIPLSLEIIPVEWHTKVRKLGVDEVFLSISPEKSKWLRGINRDQIMDVLYYSTPTFGKLIAESVLGEMNTKYRDFIKQNPGWTGRVSIFAHSLGTLIAYDILTQYVDAGTLAFEVENLFCAGSPVPIFALARGHLDIRDGKYRDGLKPPKAKNYFNIIHTADPIAYRVEPLIKAEMAAHPVVQLEESAFSHCSTFGDMVRVYKEVLKADDSMVNTWKGQRMDIQVPRAFWDMLAGDFYALQAHGDYWLSRDVIGLALMALCRPVVDIMAWYADKNHPFPSLRAQRLVPFTPFVDVSIATKTKVRDGTTGEWQPQAVFLGEKRIYFTLNATKVACTKIWSLPLSANTRITQDLTDASVLVLQQDKNNSNSPTRLLMCKSNAQDWINAIQDVVKRPTMAPNGGLPIETKGLELPTGLDVAYFGAKLTGNLQQKPSSTQTKWGYAWCVVTKTSVECYKECPAITNWVSLPMDTVFGNQAHGHFRVVNANNASTVFKISTTEEFDKWAAAIGKIHEVVLENHDWADTFLPPIKHDN
ncbi:Aste57867_10831 [Aphanomyces stellatus]|uniref:Aste57867_10831 protein n=1 Tax=Aphanomyces stellatus TaxID=120398 RepID=A0A485KRZ0_9STRA|nr:hypothetical protein As57867_010791 [Aphanomyces stellatus]VFT87699.1 Aste57867_10831 [Aphanomyces stellatus]